MYDILVERCNIFMKQQQQILNSMVVVATKEMVFYSKKKTKIKKADVQNSWNFIVVLVFLQ